MRNQGDFVGATLQLTLVDPWDFVTANGPGPFRARVIQVRLNKSNEVDGLVIEFDRPLSHSDQDCRHYIATARHDSAPLGELLRGGKISCNLTGMTAERGRGDNPFDVNLWRGGTAAIADVSL
jgi:hypothetical protein